MTREGLEDTLTGGRETGDPMSGTKPQKPNWGREELAGSPIGSEASGGYEGQAGASRRLSPKGKSGRAGSKMGNELHKRRAKP